jgi:hypothetical protein
VRFKKILEGSPIETSEWQNSEEYKMYYIFSSTEKYGNYFYQP